MDEITVINSEELSQYTALNQDEQTMLKKASELLNLGYPDHALLEIWNSGVNNLRRRIEAYSIDMFISAISGFSGRKNYKKDGGSLSERWSGVDDENLLKGANQLGLLNSKAFKALEMIEWMRNHASPAHNSDESVTNEDVMALVLIIKKNLFELPMPDPGHSPIGLIEPLKNSELTETQVELFRQQIQCYSNKDIRMLFGFGLDAICSGEEPTYSNILKLFDLIWEKSTEDLKTNMGMKFHNFLFSPQDDGSDEDAKSRLYEELIALGGIKYIPDSTRAIVYRKLASNLHDAKNAMYGWNQEQRAARALSQAGISVPSIAFEEVYQEILCVWCGNYWGKSDAYLDLEPFIFGVSTQDRLKIARLFLTNSRVREELFQSRPNTEAVSLLKRIKGTFSVESHIAEVENIIDEVRNLK